MNPYESPKIEPQSIDDTDRQVEDSSRRRTLAIMLAAASTVTLLISAVLGLYGLMLLRLTIDARGRFEGRAAIAVPVTTFVLVFASVLAIFGALGLRFSMREYKSD